MIHAVIVSIHAEGVVTQEELLRFLNYHTLEVTKVTTLEGGSVITTLEVTT